MSEKENFGSFSLCHLKLHPEVMALRGDLSYIIMSYRCGMSSQASAQVPDSVE